MVSGEERIVKGRMELWFLSKVEWKRNNSHKTRKNLEMDLSDIELTLFFTGGVGLNTWARIGNLERELELYKRLRPQFKEINMVSYGGDEDKRFRDKLGGIRLLPSSWYRIRRLSLLQLWLKGHTKTISESGILKTNQISGSEIPLWFKKKFDQKLIVRCGYLYSYFMEKKTKDKRKVQKAAELEQKAFQAADLGIVTSDWQRNLILNQYRINPPEKIEVIPNYVVTDVFKPNLEIVKKYDVIFIGKNARQKNVGNLLKAINYLEKKHRISLVMIGGCCYNPKVRQLIKQYDLNVDLMGNIPNYEIPSAINRAKLFILPSLYEGHPKALLEAMGCGIASIGTNVPGIREEIEHMVTGYLCKTDFESIANAIDIVLSDESLRKALGRNARDFIMANYSLDIIVQKELSLVQSIL